MYGSSGSGHNGYMDDHPIFTQVVTAQGIVLEKVYATCDSLAAFRWDPEATRRKALSPRPGQKPIARKKVKK